MGTRESDTLESEARPLPCLAPGMLVVLQGEERGRLPGRKKSVGVCALALPSQPCERRAGLRSQTHSRVSKPGRADGCSSVALPVGGLKVTRS